MAQQDSDSDTPWSLRVALAPGLAALRHHWPAFLVIQAAAVGIVVWYYRSDALQASASVLADLKVRGGVPFAFLVGAMVCSVIPELAKLVTGKLRVFDRRWIRDVAFTGFVYGVVAVQVDLFYRLQAALFGTGTDARTFLVKTAVDMALFSTTVSIPTAVVLFEWKKRDFRMRELVGEFSARFYRDKVLPALLPCWAFWTPVLFCAYSMPLQLQFLFSQLAEAAWSLLFVFMATQDVETLPP